MGYADIMIGLKWMFVFAIVFVFLFDLYLCVSEGI